jgi:hypothetical protein
MLRHADLARADDSTYLLNAAAANRRGFHRELHRE